MKYYGFRDKVEETIFKLSKQTRELKSLNLHKQFQYEFHPNRLLNKFIKTETHNWFHEFIKLVRPFNEDKKYPKLTYV